MENLKSKKIALLVGGINSEREVSLETGKAFARALQNLGLNFETVDAKEDLPLKLAQMKPDIALLALHGKWAEDGTVQGICEYLKIPYSGSGVLASAIGMNKPVAKQIWERNGIPTARGYVENLEGKNPAGLEPQVDFPLVVKPARDGSSVGVSICRDMEDWRKAMESAVKYDKTMLIEEYISGMEIAVAVFKGRALAPIEIAPKSGYYDYTNKYTKGKTDYFIPPRLPAAVIDELKRLSVKAFETIGARTYARFDFRVREDHRPFILEINTLPGCTETSLVPKAAAHEGISFDQFILELVKSARLDYEGVR